LFVRSQWQARRQVRVPRVALNPANVAVDDYVIVIDARGRDLEPCLYPVIRDDSGRVVYDLITLPAADVQKRVPVRYVETRVKFERLQSHLFVQELDGFELAGLEPDRGEKDGSSKNIETTSHPATGAASQPADEPKRGGAWPYAPSPPMPATVPSS
jgi:hypothetical protein